MFCLSLPAVYEPRSRPRARLPRPTSAFMPAAVWDVPEPERRQPARAPHPARHALTLGRLDARRPAPAGIGRTASSPPAFDLNPVPPHESVFLASRCARDPYGLSKRGSIVLRFGPK